MKAHLVFRTLLRKQFFIFVDVIDIRILQSSLLPIQLLICTRIPVYTDGMVTRSNHEIIDI